MTIVEFLTARLGEWEAAARAAKEATYYGAWTHYGGANGDVGTGPNSMVVDLWADVGDHVALNDPDWVLADVEAKRKLIAEYEYWEDAARGPDFGGGRAAGLELALECVALAHASHPDYAERWRP